MKRMIAFVAALVLILTFVLPVYAEGVNILSENDDRVSLFNNVKIDKPVNGNVIAVFGNIEINSNVNGIVVTVFGDAKINSVVAGQVITVIGNTWLDNNTVIEGSIFSLGQLDKEAGAKILGQEVNIFGKNMKVDMSEFLIIRVLLLLMFALITFMIGILYIAAAKKKVGDMEATIEGNLGKKILLGFTAYIGVTIILALLFITIIVPILYFVLMVFATVMSSIFLGKLIMKAMSPSNSIYLEFITGLVTLTLFELLLTFLIPGGDAIFSLLLLGVFGILINSFGIGTLFINKFAKQ